MFFLFSHHVSFGFEIISWICIRYASLKFLFMPFLNRHENGSHTTNYPSMQSILLPDSINIGILIPSIPLNMVFFPERELWLLNLSIYSAYYSPSLWVCEIPYGCHCSSEIVLGFGVKSYWPFKNVPFKKRFIYLYLCKWVFACGMFVHCGHDWCLRRPEEDPNPLNWS